MPEDVSLVGYDDLPPAADLGLITVHLPHEELGRTAVRLALQREAEGWATFVDGTAQPKSDMLRLPYAARRAAAPWR